MTIASGSILRGKYRLHDSIGKGGMGEVFEAIDLLTGQEVAIKVVRRHFVDHLLMARLHREAEAARRIQSEFVPYLYEVDYTDEQELFLAMERLRGETLAERMKRSEILSWDEVRRIGDDVLRGLIDAHAAGVIHRDLKPGNIFLERTAEGQPRARILDFGVCKLDTHDGESLTSTGEAVGTISYMAPEQIRGASKVDERADLYAFAMVVFEALSGRLAYDASGQIAMIACKLERAATPLRQVARVAVPAGLDALVARCLSRRAADRPPSAAELLRAWRALGSATVAPNPTPALAFTPLAHATETALTAAPLSRIDKRAARVGLAVAAATLVASSAILVVGLRLHGSSANAAAAPPPDLSATTAAAARPESAPSPSPSPTDVGAAPPPTGTVAVEDLPAETAPVDAGPIKAAARPKPPPRAGGTPRRPPPPPSGPQISTEPRY